MHNIAKAMAYEPVGHLKTLSEFFALASAMARDAAQTFSALSAALCEQGQNEVANIFDESAAEAQRWGWEITEWSVETVGHAPRATDLKWPAPSTFQDEDAVEITQSRLMTPYRALSIIVRNHERAFVFWSYVAAHCETEDVRQWAERMAEDELTQVADARLERRQAFHAMRARHSVGEPLSADTLEAMLAARLDEMARNAPGKAERLHALADGSRAMARSASVASFRETVGDDASADMIAEILAEGYLRNAENPEDEAQLATLQELAKHAIMRLSALRTLAEPTPRASGR